MVQGGGLLLQLKQPPHIYRWVGARYGGMAQPGLSVHESEREVMYYTCVDARTWQLGPGHELAAWLLWC